VGTKKIIKKHLKKVEGMRKFSIFAMFPTRTIFMTFVCVAIFNASYTAHKAEKYRLSSPRGCCTAKSVIVLVGKRCDSLFHINNFSFSFMTRTMKKASSVKHSSAQARPTHETGNLIHQFFKDFSHLLNRSGYVSGIW
jgi:hypothetical protein